MSEQSHSNSQAARPQGPTYPSGLAERVIAEVNSWDTSIAVNGVSAPYADATKSIYYGIGLKVARSAYEKIVQKSTLVSANYWDRSLNLAKKAFMKDYLIYHLSRHGYDVLKSSGAMGCDHSHTYSLLKRMGLNIRELRENRDGPMPQGGSVKRENLDDLVRDAEREILEYSGLFKESLPIYTQIKNNAGTIAKAIVKIASDFASTVMDNPSTEPLLKLHYKQAIRGFEERYVRRVFKKTKFDSEAAIKLMGFKGKFQLRNFLSNRGWTKRWFRDTQQEFPGVRQ